MFHFNAAVGAFEQPVADLRIDQVVFHGVKIFLESRGILGQRPDLASLTVRVDRTDFSGYG